MRRKPPPLEPPLYAVCAWCGADIGDPGFVLCSGCNLRFFDILKDITAIHKKYASVEEEDIPAETRTLLSANYALMRLMLYTTEVQKRLGEYDAWVDAVQEWEKRRGRTPKPSTVWLRENHGGRSMSVVYPEWRAVDGSEDTAETWDSYRRLWKREIDGKK
jgi:hypothetical protein